MDRPIRRKEATPVEGGATDVLNKLYDYGDGINGGDDDDDDDNDNLITKRIMLTFEDRQRYWNWNHFVLCQNSKFIISNRSMQRSLRDKMIS